MTKASTIRRLVLSASLVAGLALLGGCGSHEPAQVKIRGTLSLADGSASPGNGAMARVSLLRHDEASNSDRIVAERTLHDLGQPPIDFTLVVGRALLDRSAAYGLSAQIIDANGNVTWQTGAAKRVAALDQDHPAALRLAPYRVSADGPFATYRCGDGFTFQLAKDSDGGLVHLGQRQISLHRGKSLTANSIRYVDEHQDEIVIGHGVTSIYFDGVSHHDCAPVAATHADTSGG